MTQRLLSTLFLLLMIVYGCSAADARKEKKVFLWNDDSVSLGVAVSNIKPELLKERNLKGGAEILDVLDDSEAEKIGLKEGDIITAFDGKEVADAKALNDMVTDIKKETIVKLTVNRDGKTIQFDAKLSPSKPRHVEVNVNGEDFDFDIGDHPLPHIQFHGAPGMDIPFASRNGAYLGVEATSLTKQLMSYFNVDHGVLIETVEKDTPAEKAGLKAGDIILEISGKQINDYHDLIRTLNYYDPKDKVTITYSCKGKTEKTDVTLGERKNTVWISDNGEGMEDLGRKIEIKMDKARENLKSVKEKLQHLNIDVDLYII